MQDHKYHSSHLPAPCSRMREPCLLTQEEGNLAQALQKVHFALCSNVVQRGGDEWTRRKAEVAEAHRG